MMEKLSEEFKSHTYKSKSGKFEATKFENFYPDPVGKISKRPGRFSVKNHEVIWQKFKNWLHSQCPKT